MWPKAYKDYKRDEELIKYPVQPGKGIIGCEMHEINGWGNTFHVPPKKKRGIIGSLVQGFFHLFDRKGKE